MRATELHFQDIGGDPTDTVKNTQILILITFIKLIIHALKIML